MRCFGSFLSKLHVLLFNIDGYRCSMPLDLLAYVSFITNLNHILLKYFRFRSLLQGKASHKFVDLSSNPIMHHYYSNRNFLFFMCMGNEMFYCTLYLLYFTPGPSSEYFADKVVYAPLN